MTFTQRIKDQSQFLKKNAKKYNDLVIACGNSILDNIEFGGKILTMGNGGSAADAQHMVAELVGRFKKNREPVPAICLNTNVSTLTSISNDYNYSNVFARQIEALCDPVDVVIGFSTSGNSKNILNAIKKANNIGAFTIAITGFSGGKLIDTADFVFNVELESTPEIQEIHIMFVHMLCEYLENKMFD